ncbi:MAG: hypothetical protein AB1469_02495 [Pseudomonadota bacterium]
MSEAAHKLSPDECWGDIIALTRSMLDAAHAQRWEIVANLEKQRGALLDLALAAEATVAGHKWLAAPIKHLLALNRQLVALGEGQLCDYERQLQNIALGRRAEQLYGENTPPSC